jgi:hypothetical protein
MRTDSEIKHDVEDELRGPHGRGPPAPFGTRAGAATALTRRFSADCAVWPHDSRTLNVSLSAIALYSD